jgi:hypothetical protein
MSGPPALVSALAHVLARAIGLHASDAVVVPDAEVARIAAAAPAPAPWAPNAVRKDACPRRRSNLRLPDTNPWSSARS